MTKRDIRIRRGSFSKGQIERYKDFEKFSGLYEKEKTKGLGQKMWIVIIGVIFVLAMILIGYFTITQNREKREFKVPKIEKAENTIKINKGVGHLVVG